VSESEVTRLVTETTDEKMRTTEREAREVMRQADDYAMRVLKSLENSINKVLGNIEQGKEALERVQDGGADDAQPRERSSSRS
jgi:serine/threonine-protein kinase RIO1